jgi:predicted outer membrane lipoprotein
MLEDLAWILGTLLFVFAALGAIAMLYLSRKEKKPEEILTATSEWLPTGKIDFHCAETPKDDKVPAAFLLRMEECRTVESISGAEHVEIRWRNATLAEARSVVVAHKAGDGGAKGAQFLKLVRA